MTTTPNVEQIVLASITAAGPAGNNLGAWKRKVKDLSTEVTLMLSEKSAVSKNVANLLACETPFVATIMGGGVEKSSTRLLVRLQTTSRDGSEVKEEEIRTERTDSADGKAMSDLVKSLKHHRVLIYKQKEKGEGDRVYRVLRHIVDLGVDESVAAGEPVAAVA